jgi:serine O-acetyltransferase
MSRRSRLLWDLPANCPSLRHRPVRPGDVAREMLNLRVLAVFAYRISQLLGQHSHLGASIVKQLNQLITGADIAWESTIGPGLVIFHPVGLVVGKGVVAGRCLTLQQGVTLGGEGTMQHDLDAFPTLGDEVHVGAGARVIGAVNVGDRVFVGANAVVVRDVPSDSIAVGVPARHRPRSPKLRMSSYESA